jgi:FtsH-binding integral membrane protein
VNEKLQLRAVWNFIIFELIAIAIVAYPIAYLRIYIHDTIYIVTGIALGMVLFYFFNQRVTKSPTLVRIVFFILGLLSLGVIDMAGGVISHLPQ